MKDAFIGVLRLTALLVVLVLLSMLCACDSSGAELIISSDTYSIKAGETLDIEEFKEKYLTDTSENSTAPPYTTELPDTTGPPTEWPNEDDTLDIPENDLVYWVKNGEVWHVTRECSSLWRSKNILSGTLDEAIVAGKSRMCKRCGNQKSN